MAGYEGRHTLNRFVLTIVIIFANCEYGWSSETNVTKFIFSNTAVPQTVDREWKKNCPDLFCGSIEQKQAKVIQVHMDKKSKVKIFVRGTVVANASFGFLSPLNDKQTIIVSGDANPIACTFKIDKLQFSDGVAQFLIDLFAGLEGKIYPFRDRRGKCDQYFPKDL
jgi:hypothetical protein